MPSEQVPSILCPACGGTLTMDVHAPPKIMNDLYASIIVVSHPKTKRCPSCETELYLGIAQMNLGFGALAVPDADKKNLIIAPRPALVTE